VLFRAQSKQWVSAQSGSGVGMQCVCVLAVYVLFAGTCVN